MNFFNKHLTLEVTEELRTILSTPIFGKKLNLTVNL